MRFCDCVSIDVCQNDQNSIHFFLLQFKNFIPLTLLLRFSPLTLIKNVGVFFFLILGELEKSHKIGFSMLLNIANRKAEK